MRTGFAAVSENIQLAAVFYNREKPKWHFL